MSTKAILWLAAGLVILAVSFLVFVRECAYNGGMGAAFKECRCRGVEWVLYDHTPADGPRRTLCIGLIASRKCHRGMGGAEFDCKEFEAERRAHPRPF